MTTLEKIRAEIEQIADEEQKHDEKWAIGLRYAVKIIDKYAEQEPCDKCAMKNSNSNYCKNCMVAEYNGKKVSVPTKFVKQEPCDDVVSREDAIIQISWDFPTLELPKIKESLDKLPSVRPQEQTGQWIKIKSGDKDFPESIVCSRCNNENSHLDFNENAEPIGKVFVTSNYCPNCGAKMVEPKESEDKE